MRRTVLSDEEEDKIEADEEDPRSSRRGRDDMDEHDDDDDDEDDARSLLTAKAKHWLHMEYGKQLWSKVTVAPWRKKDADKKDADIDLDDESELRVMACCWGPGKPATTFVMLDSSGELVDVLYAGSISNRSQGVAEQQRKKNDQRSPPTDAVHRCPDLLPMPPPATAPALSLRRLQRVWLLGCGHSGGFATPPASPPPPAAGAEITCDAVGAVRALAAWPEVWIEFPVLALDGGGGHNVVVSYNGRHNNFIRRCL